jgi:MFS family permease
VPISAIDSVNLAVQHTKQQLFQPFRFWQWTRLAVVGLLAGELGGGGGPRFNPSQLSSAQRVGEFPKIDPTILVPLITIGVLAGFVFLIVMAYISSVMRFVLFDSVLAKECHIRAGWFRRQEPGWKLFLWQLGFLFFSFVGAVLLFGIPAVVAFGMGWFNPPSAHVLPLVLGGIFVFFLLIAYIIFIALVHMLTKDFVVPQMALEGIGAVEGWRRLWPTIEADQKDFIFYVLMKLVLAIGAAILIAIVTVILALVFAIPVVGVVIASVIAAKSAALTWNALTITAAVVAGCVLLAIFFYLVSLISVPVLVFFPAFSIYFFAARYRPLALALYPQQSPASPPELLPGSAPQPAG